MKKSILLSIVALLISVASFAQQAEQANSQPPVKKVFSVEEIAKKRADMMRQHYLLGQDQYNKVYKLCLKQAKKDKERREQIKAEKEQMNKDMKAILNDAQWERYQKMQQRPNFSRNNNRRPMPANFCQRCPWRQKPMQKPRQNPQIKKGVQIHQPQGRNNNAYIDKGHIDLQKRAEQRAAEQKAE